MFPKREKAKQVIIKVILHFLKCNTFKRKLHIW